MNVEYKDTAWHILQALKECGAQTRASLVGDDEYTKQVFTHMLRAGLIRTNIDMNIVLSPSGSKTLRKVNEAQAGPLEFASKRTWVAEGFYDGKELRQTCLRKGAYDAFALPSLMHDGRHYRKEIKA